MDAIVKMQLVGIVQKIAELFNSEVNNGLIFGPIRDGGGNEIGAIVALRSDDPDKYPLMLDAINSMANSQEGGMVENSEPEEQGPDWDSIWMP